MRIGTGTEEGSIKLSGVTGNQAGTQTDSKTGRSDKGQKTQKINSVYAGDLSLAKDTRKAIEEKRKFAQKQAMKLVGDAWGRDQAASQTIDDMRNEKSEQVKKIGDLKLKLKDMENDKKGLQEEYGVASDSQEQKDLELLEKYQNNKNGSSYDEFSEEEISRLKELQDMPRTEYQNKVLAQNAVVGQTNLEIERLEDKLYGMTISINDAKKEQLKSQDMLDATAASDQIMQAAEDEALGMLIQDGMDTVDETRKEEQEEAEEAAKKEQEQKEQVEDTKKDQEEQKDLIQGDTEADKLEQNASLQKQNTSQVQEAQKNIQSLLKKNNLVNEDIKGIEIDLNF